ncbi:MAG: hypothetical protein K2M13_08965 [Muribaculaceae bacterium]|nr:hypothetical protein [Muribaculaceae bacterium]
MSHKITFYPVRNGDCNLIEFSDNAIMLVDCNFIQDAEKNEDPLFNVIKDLTETKLGKKFELPYLDAFVLTHPDQDHCRGFSQKFFLKDPNRSTPTKTEIENKLLIIGELWYSPRIFAENKVELSDDAKAFKKEAERRMKLWRENDANKNKDGNRIKIIGYINDEDYQCLPDSVKAFPGDTVSTLNGKSRDKYSFFIHAPFKDDIEGEDRNCTSIVFQVRFNVEDEEAVGKLILGGDAEWPVWSKIQENTSDDEYLKWNIFEAPHHCSYTFFADDREDEPEQSSLDFLAYREGNGYIVSSSKIIKKNNDNPPCQKAKNRYLDAMDDREEEEYFLCTTTADDKGNPVYKPVVFEIVKDGVRKLIEKGQTKATRQGSAPHFYG